MLSFSVGTPFGDEFAKAREVAAFFDSDHHELTLTAAELEAFLPELIWSLETYDPAILQILAPLAFLFKAVSGYVSTIHTGYGADLIFAGVADMSLPEVQLEAQLGRGVAAAMHSNELSPAIASRHGITVRHPYWTPQMLSVGMAIPARHKVAHGIEKYVFRHSMEQVVPPCVAWRPKVGIHEGSSMRRLIAQVLGCEDEQAQLRLLRKLAERTFLDRVQPTSHQPMAVDHACAVDLA
jgi:carbapenam-3-carboxylate synthase